MRSPLEEIAALVAALGTARDRKAPWHDPGEALSTYTLQDLQHLVASPTRTSSATPAPYRRKLSPRDRAGLRGLATPDAPPSAERHERVFGKAHSPLYGTCRSAPDLTSPTPGTVCRSTRRSPLLTPGAFTCCPGAPRAIPWVPVSQGSAVGRATPREVLYCPVREKEDDVETSICPFWPGKAGGAFRR